MNAPALRTATFIRFAAIALAMSGSPSQAALPFTWHETTEVAAGRGERGPWQQNESRYDYVDDPTVALAEQGEIALAWVDQASKDVFFQRFAADSGRQLDQALNVSRNPATFSWLPRIVVSPHAPNQVFIIWQEIIFSGGSHGGDILFARSDDGGTTFAAPVNLSNSPGGDGKGRINREIWHNGSLDLAVGTDGTLYAAWTEYDGPLWLSRSSDGGKRFSPPQRIAGGEDALPARGPSLAPAPDGALYLAWTVGEDAAADIRVAKSTDGGISFGEARIAAQSSAYSDAPKLAVDPGGVLHLVYSESAGGPFGPQQIHYTRSADGARSFEPPREISKPARPTIESSGFPALSIDADGVLYVLWELYPDHRRRPRGLGLAVSPDGGRSFTPPELVPGSRDPAGGTNGSHQGLLMDKLAVSRDGGLIAIVNSSLNPGEYSRVWLMRKSRGP